MSSAGKWAAGLGALGALILVSSSKKRGDESESNNATIGWGPALDPNLAKKFEDELESRQPVEIDKWESEKPACGSFYLARRKDTWLGTGEKSITYSALKNTLLEIADEEIAEKLASNSLYRLQYFSVCVAGWWNDMIYGTHATRGQTPLGPHGRGIDLRPVHARNRDRLVAGEAAARAVDRGEPGEAGSARACTMSRGDEMPLLWLPFVDEDALLRGVVSCRGCEWPDGESAMDPPPEVRALGWAVI